MTGQALAAPEDVSAVTAILLCMRLSPRRSFLHSFEYPNNISVSQTLGGAFLVSPANSAFVNTLMSKVAVNAPSVLPASVVAAGATGLRQAFSVDELPPIIDSYMSALKATYAIAIATAGSAFVVSLFGRWNSIKGKAVVGAA